MSPDQTVFQSFKATTRPETGPPRLAALREELARAGLAGFLVPRADAHQGEYVAPCDDRLAWLTGFTGSAGFAIALRDRAALFVDGRYTAQARAQVDAESFATVDWPATRPGPWLAEALPEGGVVGYDPWLYTPEQLAGVETGLTGTKVTLRPCENLVDRIWPDRPAPPEGMVRVYPDALAGETHDAKRARLGAELDEAGQDAAVLTLPDSIAWMLNIRGSDIPRNPVPHGFAILHRGGAVDLFMAAAKLTEEVRAHLGAEVAIHTPEGFGAALDALRGPVRLDRGSVPQWVVDRLDAAGIRHNWGADLCVLPKARKTTAEIAATREAHLRDGAAMCEFLAWYDAQPQGSLTEIDVVRELEARRRATGKLLDISFDTIAGAGPHGALPHYRVSEESNRALTPGDLLVLDSGGQYEDGTTDITRTLPVGEAGADERAAFTRVLKGMIALSRMRWPRGLAGRDLDSIARYPLWLADQDYAHGTGHGIGVHLCVHEGPQRISRASDVPLEPGMILSNEPGYYREGAFGIRIENIVVVTRADPMPGGDGRDMLTFETLNYVPIDRRLVDLDLLGVEDRAWLDRYHADVRARIEPRLTAAARDWLIAATAPL